MKRTFNNTGKKVVLSLAASMLVFGSGFTASETFAASSYATAVPENPTTPKFKEPQHWTINKHFTLAEARQIVESGKKISDVSEFASVFAAFKAQGLVPFLFIYGKTVEAQMTPFKTAIANNSGVTFKYDYVLPAGVSGGSGNIENRSVTYE
ncbi:hypothetical protein [Saccharibacillus sp. JS10]|uniref:hypothetical protein n=1 Tax=Saccharibacillus sp. JS10 TaxID=2950552 RepID=UPI00210D9FE6|nr:hypothetical protein [Saccharibacillus sp. JS10]MCQ4085978.1 hypothetical protein [Saccharibacillus sp. JS10]